MPPLPSPGNVVRLHMRYGPSDTNQWGSRWYYSYTGGPPSGADLNSFCSDAATSFATNIMEYVGNTIYLTEVTAIDLSSDTGNEGSWTGSHQGVLTGAALVEDSCMQMNCTIPRHYRGGKPKIFLPPATAAQLANDNSWQSTLITDINAGWVTFNTYMTGLTFTSFSPQAHVNVSYYKGFTVFTTPSGRARNIPTPRATPVVDTITSTTLRGIVGVQRRRRSAVTG